MQAQLKQIKVTPDKFNHGGDIIANVYDGSRFQHLVESVSDQMVVLPILALPKLIGAVLTCVSANADNGTIGCR